MATDLNKVAEFCAFVEKAIKDDPNVVFGDMYVPDEYDEALGG